MGSSGSGKTTLLNILAGRNPGKMHGTIHINGKPQKSSSYLSRHSAYVLQHEELLANLTIHETLSYAADLRLPAEMKRLKTTHRLST